MFRFRWIDLFAAVALEALAALLFAVLTVTAAPAPIVRPKAAPRMVERLRANDLAGEWLLTWGQCEYRMTLSAFGTYRCWHENGCVWVGQWFNNLDDLSMCVAEQIVYEDGTLGRRMFWEVDWGKDARGRINPACPHGEAAYADRGDNVIKVSMKRVKR